ncbi:ACP S-malonyltransferase [Bombilactobacillus thymidiniphilus]|uniref:Malonyl CoA-acyl carrier protein transacylase n=1 Tax=Bombilactobacillus thymidiniphilus TaxID=2923363 RepID=A0ABY4PF53_9LACO|nr:ACP S-malonyltransferase [Bombilactobacillus thymidiniphilus]UQS84227.1 ACP S-malonyltransferase [Bombilactobacillus thymidiniphilus]
MIGLLFSGQGAQKTGITQDIYEKIPSYRQSIDQASSILGLDVAGLLFDEQNADKLAMTQYAQPVIVAMSYGLFQLIKDSLPKNKFGTGLSLGEYSALACGGYVGFATALNLIKRRGELMQQASDQTDSKMVAVMKADLADVEAVCRATSDLGAIGVANINTPKQIVIGGQTTAVDQAADQLATKNNARIIPLDVSGAFHTPVMQPIQEQLRRELVKVDWQEGIFPVYSTTTKTDFVPQQLAQTLTDQLVSTTYFADTLMEHGQGLDAVIEVGPGKTLLSFARKIVRGVKTYRIDSLTDLEQTIATLEAK